MTTNRFMLIGVMGLGALMGCTSVHQSTAKSGEPTRDPKAVMLDFYQVALGQKQVRPAFERFTSSTFVEHKPDVPVGDRESTIRYLEELVVSLPDAQWEVVRTIAEGDWVFLHAKFVPAPGAPPYAIADVFRVQNGLIVEHWDVVAGPPKDPVNPHSRF
ncbi:MAG: nuclear transport factor 2 family protein [Verrucomicrobia bacterium]|nr:nuclear transport factor 2 family protein [Verrucomicrobiota bacterium]